jgi:hypothetical protein
MDLKMKAQEELANQVEDSVFLLRRVEPEGILADGPRYCTATNSAHYNEPQSLEIQGRVAFSIEG